MVVVYIKICKLPGNPGEMGTSATTELNKVVSSSAMIASVNKQFLSFFF